MAPLTVALAPPGSRYESARRRFVSDIESIVGKANIRAGYLPHRLDAKTTVDPWTGRVWTSDAVFSPRPWGKGYFRHFNSTTNLFTTPDTANMSFTTGAADQAFSGIAYLQQPAGVGAFQDIISKYGGAVGEYEFRLDNSIPPKLQMLLQSGANSGTRLQDTGIAQTSPVFYGQPISVGFTYDGSGGATQMNGVALYLNGAVAASTATNAAGYTFMADTTDVPAIGARGTGAVFYAQGIGFTLVVAGALTAGQMAAIDGACKAYFTGGY